MKVVVIYDSVFGNTKEVAYGIQSAYDEKGEDVKLYHIKDINHSQLDDIDLIVIGSPTRGFKPTKDIVAFIKSMDKTVYKNSKFKIFDTRMDIKTVDNKLLTFMAKRFGFANDTLIKLIRKHGGVIQGEAIGFIVEESEGPLRNDEMNQVQRFVSDVN